MAHLGAFKNMFEEIEGANSGDHVQVTTVFRRTRYVNCYDMLLCCFLGTLYFTALTALSKYSKLHLCITSRIVPHSQSHPRYRHMSCSWGVKCPTSTTARSQILENRGSNSNTTFCHRILPFALPSLGCCVFLVQLEVHIFWTRTIPIIFTL